MCRFKEISLPEGLERIDVAALAGTTGLSKVVFPSTLKSLGIEVLSHSSVDTVVFKEGNEMPDVDGVFYNENHDGDRYNMSSVIFLVPLKYYKEYKKDIPLPSNQVEKRDKGDIIYPYFKMEHSYKTFSFPYPLDLSTCTYLNDNFEDPSAGNLTFNECINYDPEGYVTLNALDAYSGRYPFTNSGDIRSVRW